MGADILAQAHGSTRCRWLPSFDPAHAADRQHSKPGEAAGNKAGTAQEGAPIESSLRLAGIGDQSAPAATSLPIWSAYQHGRSYFPG